MSKMLKSLAVGAMALFVWAGAAQAALITIYSHTFDGANTAINDTSPDTGGNDWIATSTFRADGTIGGTGAGTATLAFTPENDLVYTLDASFTSIAGGTDWIALAFANGQSTSSSSHGNENRFLEEDTVGVAWMFAREENPHQAFLGDPAAEGGNQGLADGADWNGGPTNGGDIDMRVVLNTTGGTGAWTATWYAKRPADSDYTVVRATATMLSEDITSVGFGKANTGATGTIESFSLTSIPEPASGLLLLGGAAGLGLLRRRRSAA